MIRLSVLYPAGRGPPSTTTTTGRATSRSACAPGAGPDAEIDRGVDGPYVAAVHLQFASLDHGGGDGGRGDGRLLADIANYTNITPVLQTSEVVA